MLPWWAKWRYSIGFDSSSLLFNVAIFKPPFLQLLNLRFDICDYLQPSAVQRIELMELTMRCFRVMMMLLTGCKKSQKKSRKVKKSSTNPTRQQQTVTMVTNCDPSGIPEGPGSRGVYRRRGGWSVEAGTGLMGGRRDNRTTAGRLDRRSTERHKREIERE